MTKYNIGDKTELPIASGVVTATAGSGTCTPSSSKYCCWKGTTSTSCDSANGDYSGCTRTVCDWRAANDSCNKLTYQSKSWRLPTSEELTYFRINLQDASINKGSNGVMLCDNKSGYLSTRCGNSTLCSGAAYSGCHPDPIWCSNTSSSEKAYYYGLDGGTWYGPYNGPMSHAMSSRCVSDL